MGDISQSRKLGSREKEKAAEEYEKREKQVVEVEVPCRCYAYVFPHYHNENSWIGPKKEGKNVRFGDGNTVQIDGKEAKQ
jgi:hypothetical protein